MKYLWGELIYIFIWLFIYLFIENYVPIDRVITSFGATLPTFLCHSVCPLLCGPFRLFLHLLIHSNAASLPRNQMWTLRVNVQTHIVQHFNEILEPIIFIVFHRFFGLKSVVIVLKTNFFTAMSGIHVCGLLDMVQHLNKTSQCFERWLKPLSPQRSWGTSVQPIKSIRLSHNILPFTQIGK